MRVFSKSCPSGVSGFRPFPSEDIYDSIELRGLLEGAAARMAAERLTDPRTLEPLAELSQEILNLIRKPKMTIDAFTYYIDLNARFHAALLDLAGSRMLRRAIDRACCLPFASPSAFLKRQYISERPARTVSDLRRPALSPSSTPSRIVKECAPNRSPANMPASRGAISKTLSVIASGLTFWQAPN